MNKLAVFLDANLVKISYWVRLCYQIHNRWKVVSTDSF
jgi:hypothetical protein